MYADACSALENSKPVLRSRSLGGRSARLAGNGDAANRLACASSRYPCFAMHCSAVFRTRRAPAGLAYGESASGAGNKAASKAASPTSSSFGVFPKYEAAAPATP